MENDPGVVIVQSKCQKGSVHKKSGLLQDMHGGVLVRRTSKEWLAGLDIPPERVLSIYTGTPRSNEQAIKNCGRMAARNAHLRRF